MVVKSTNVVSFQFQRKMGRCHSSKSHRPMIFIDYQPTTYWLLQSSIPKIRYAQIFPLNSLGICSCLWIISSIVLKSLFRKYSKVFLRTLRVSMLCTLISSGTLWTIFFFDGMLCPPFDLICCVMGGLIVLWRNNPTHLFSYSNLV